MRERQQTQNQYFRYLRSDLHVIREQVSPTQFLSVVHRRKYLTTASRTSGHCSRHKAHCQLYRWKLQRATISARLVLFQRCLERQLTRMHRAVGGLIFDDKIDLHALRHGTANRVHWTYAHSSHTGERLDQMFAHEDHSRCGHAVVSLITCGWVVGLY